MCLCVGLYVCICVCVCVRVVVVVCVSVGGAFETWLLWMENLMETSTTIDKNKKKISKYQQWLDVNSFSLNKLLPWNEKSKWIKNKNNDNKN